MTATHGYLTTLGHSTTLGGTYTLVAEVVNVDPPELETTVSDSWHLTSTAAMKTFIPGMVDPGEMAFMLRWTKAQYNTLHGLIRTALFWKVTFPDGTTFAVGGFLKTLGAPKVAEDDTINQDCSIKASGAVTYTPAV